MNVSFQLYSARSLPGQHEFLKTLAGIGYTEVEGFAGVYTDPIAYRAAMDDVGIRMPSGHFALSDLESNFEAQMSIAKTLGVADVVVPYLAEEDRPKNVEGYQSIAQRLNKLYEQLNGEGYSLAWHNHDFELEALPDGSVPLDVILTEAPYVSWEADLAWVAVAKADPAEWVETWGSRISAVHVKDLAPAGNNTDEDGWADVGEGTINWKSLMFSVRQVAPDAHAIMEHDNPSDVQRFASVSFANFSSY